MGVGQTFAFINARVLTSVYLLGPDFHDTEYIMVSYNSGLGVLQYRQEGESQILHQQYGVLCELHQCTLF